MDLDTILGLLFFVFFVVLPLFSRAGKGKKGQPAQGRPGKGQAQADGRLGSPSTTSPAPGGPTASTGQDTPSATLAEIRRRVEEAQRRESERARMAGKRATAQAPSAGRPGSLVGSDPFEGALVSVPERRLSEIGERRFPGLGPEGGTGQDVVPASGGKGPAGGSVSEATPSLGRSGPIGREGPLGREGARQALSPSVVPATRTARRIARAARSEIGSEGLRGDGRRPGSGPVTARLGAAAAPQTDKAGIMQGLIWHEILSPPLSLRRRRER